MPAVQADFFRKKSGNAAVQAVYKKNPSWQKVPAGDKARLMATLGELEATGETPLQKINGDGRGGKLRQRPQSSCAAATSALRAKDTASRHSDLRLTPCRYKRITYVDSTDKRDRRFIASGTRVARDRETAQDNRFADALIGLIR
ncbi:hypothetical protein Tco_1504501 [Tanacetum coccineum]